MASNFYQNLVLNGLSSVSTAVPAAGPYKVDGKISLPSLVAGSSANSSVVAVVNKNGSAIYTGVAGAEGFGVEANCAAGDVLQVVLSSSAAVDSGLNVVKSTIAISGGQ